MRAICPRCCLSITDQIEAMMYVGSGTMNIDFRTIIARRFPVGRF
jgi:hypothetical protein